MMGALCNSTHLFHFVGIIHNGTPFDFLILDFQTLCGNLLYYKIFYGY